MKHDETWWKRQLSRPLCPHFSTKWFQYVYLIPHDRLPGKHSHPHAAIAIEFPAAKAAAGAFLESPHRLLVSDGLRLAKYWNKLNWTNPQCGPNRLLRSAYEIRGWHGSRRRLCRCLQLTFVVHKICVAHEMLQENMGSVSLTSVPRTVGHDSTNQVIDYKYKTETGTCMHQLPLALDSTTQHCW